MDEHPIKRNEAIVSPEMWSALLWNGSFVAALSTMFLTWDSVYDYFNNDDAIFLTAFFSFFIFICVINAFNVRTPKLNIFAHIRQNTGFIRVITLIFFVQILFTYVGGRVLRTVPLSKRDWYTVIGASLI